MLLFSLFSDKSLEAFKDWTKYDDAQETFCEIDGKSPVLICIVT